MKKKIASGNSQLPSHVHINSFRFIFHSCVLKEVITLITLDSFKTMQTPEIKISVLDE